MTITLICDDLREAETQRDRIQRLILHFCGIIREKKQYPEVVRRYKLKATRLLRKRNLLDASIKRLDTKLTNVRHIRDSLIQAKENQRTLELLRSVDRHFKQLNPEKTIDELRDVMSSLQNTTEIINEPLQEEQDNDVDDLEAQLDLLLNEQQWPIIPDDQVQANPRKQAATRISVRQELVF